VAIACLRAKIIGRSQNQSAVACAAYRSGEVLHDEHSQKTFNYQRKEGVIANGIEAPEGAPAWASNRSELWNRVEKIEKRKDSQLAREFILALPRELTHDVQVELTQRLAADLAAEGMAVDWAVHVPRRGKNQDNVHAHLMLTTREINAEGFGAKSAGSLARSWNTDEWLEAKKLGFEKMANAHLVAMGHAPISFEERKGKGQGTLPPGKYRELQEVTAVYERECQEITMAAEKEIAEYDAEIGRIRAEMEAMYAAREEEKQQAAPPQITPLEQLAIAVEAARRGGPEQLQKAAGLLGRLQNMAGPQAKEYPQLAEAQRSIARRAAYFHLALDKETGQIRPMTKKEIEREDDRGR
jgi:hypothetical protein